MKKKTIDPVRNYKNKKKTLRKQISNGVNKKKISILGLGKLGLPLAACFAARGFKTIGIDIQESVVNSINKGLSPIVEPGLSELISKFRHNLRATQTYQEAIEETDVTFVIVATPSDSRGNFSNVYVESALKSLSKAFKKSKKNYHLFVISSTVMPGSVERRLIPLIEKHSGKKLNVDFGVCYIPDFVALGNTIQGFLKPDLVVIGESNKFAGNQAVSIYEKFCENKPHIARMSIINGEIAKLSLNNYITLKISFANTLANLCEKIPGADVDTISRAIGADRRIAPAYLRGGLSFGGTCFPRDTKAYLVLLKKYSLEPKLIKAVEKVNEFQNKHLAKVVLDCLRTTGNKKVSILGLSFKPDTPVIVESPAIKLIKRLLKQNIKVTVYDPLAMSNTREIFHNRISYTASVKDCISKSSLCVITTPAKIFEKINSSYFFHEPTIIIDCWRILDSQRLGRKVKYVPLGRYI